MSAEPKVFEVKDPFLTDKQVAEMLGVAQITLKVWRSLGRGPTFAKLGRSVRYRMSAVEDFISAGTVEKKAD